MFSKRVFSVTTSPVRYRGRIAPSPTGLLHLGHARTFWTAYQRAGAGGGILVLRNEDLDPQRSNPEYAAAMLQDLRWLGIAWGEGPDVGGPFGPYLQSERYALYRSVWEQLRQNGLIYPCRCSRRELAGSASAPHEGTETPHCDDEPIYPGSCRPPLGNVSQAETPAGMNWRFRVPEGEVIAFNDEHFGPQRYIAGRDFGDFPVWRRDDVPSYQLAAVVDDAAMAITEVVRGADLLKSTARQILLYRALGFIEPAWYHCDLLRDRHGERLAKRTDALSLRALRAAGVSADEVRRRINAWGKISLS